LARDVSLRHGDDAGSVVVSLGALGVGAVAVLEAGDEVVFAVLAKKPRMLFCCLPVDEAELVLLSSVGGLAGVLAAMLPAVMSAGTVPGEGMSFASSSRRQRRIRS